MRFGSRDAIIIRFARAIVHSPVRTRQYARSISMHQMLADDHAGSNTTRDTRVRDNARAHARNARWPARLVRQNASQIWGTEFVEHSPVGSNSQFPSPSVLVSDVSISNADDRGEWCRSSLAALVTPLAAAITPIGTIQFFLHVRARCQVGPQGTAPERGPYALLHGALPHIMAQRRHLLANRHWSLWTMMTDWVLRAPLTADCQRDQ